MRFDKKKQFIDSSCIYIEVLLFSFRKNSMDIDTITAQGEKQEYSNSLDINEDEAEDELKLVESSNQVQTQSNNSSSCISSSVPYYKCMKCNQTFELLDGLKLHLKWNHTATKEKLCGCNHCNKGFKKSWLLKEHIKGHTGERSYLCNQCGKSFLRNITLKKHLKIHAGEKNYICSHCGNNTFRHEKTHKKTTYIREAI